ncbi:MAG: phosphotransferase family protein [Candidatus Dadabacteria bacterium]|nr:MAG: phosphotransferase family protein [Candidatus Dadabacteria bacterium]
MTIAEDTTEVRPAHRFDVLALERYLAEHIEGLQTPIEVRQFRGGQSNPTFLVIAGSRRFVMRKKPPGKLLPSAHQVDREYRVMKALASTGVPVPAVHCLCEDDRVIGTAFYVMDFVDGRIFRDPQLPELSREERRAVYDNLNSVLATLHTVDYEQVGLSDFGRPGNYFSRQISRWTKQYRDAQTDEIPSMEALIEWLPENVPDDDTSAIVHGDFRLDNAIFHSTEPRIVAMLDWELSTIGHPLADLGYNCIPYHMNTPTLGGLVGVDFEATGIPSEQEYVEAYCRRTGRSGIDRWEFYIAFSIFRLAAISQGVYKRGLDGNASSEEALMFKDACRFLADIAWSILKQAKLV